MGTRIMNPLLRIAFILSIGIFIALLTLLMRSKAGRIVVLGLVVLGGVVALIAQVSPSASQSAARGPQTVSQPTSAAQAASPVAAVAPTPAPAVAATSGPPTPVPPTVTPLPSLTPTQVAVDMAGRVPSDLPGAELTPGTTVTSVLDSNAKRRDVYELDVKAGQTVRVTISSSPGANITVEMVQSKKVGAAPVLLSGGNDRKTYTSATSERFAISVFAGGNGRYTLRVDLV